MGPHEGDLRANQRADPMTPGPSPLSTPDGSHGSDSSHGPAPQAAYIHVPFCRHRCGYCSFTLVAGRDDLIQRYLEAIDRELASLQGPHPVQTLYFGGGTPSHLPSPAFRRLAEIARRHFPLLPGYEWSLEVNPSDVTPELVDQWADQGITRLSLGVQSFSTPKLRRLERDHDAAIVRSAVAEARRRLDNISLDLIFAAPEESLDDWCDDLRQTLDLKPQHVSTYGLTYERGAQFWNRRERGELIAVEESIERAMYEVAIEQLSGAGFEHYEVSNFAKPGRRCRHNEVYWSGQGYFAAGPGAASYVDGERRMNHGSTTTYLNRVLAGESPIQFRERLNPSNRAREYLVFGLRRLEGVNREQFRRQTGFQIDQLVGSEVARFQALGLLDDDGQTVRLTREGLLVSDSLWPELLVPRIPQGI
jgi:oxygen-independent coproporphyrinogen III oxidase